MKIAFVCQTYSENMGYITNCLPKSLVKLGHEVHVVAPNVQAYYSSPTYNETYAKFLGPPIVEVGSKEKDGVWIHRLPHQSNNRKGEAFFQTGTLLKILDEIKPDIVQTFAVESIVMRQTAETQKKLGFKLFAASHVLRSVFPLAEKWDSLNPIRKIAWKLRHRNIGQKISEQVERYYYQTIDAEEIGTQFYGADKTKSKIESLGVDTDNFSKSNELKNKGKKDLNFSVDDFICVYTGRFSEGKSPLILAKAIDSLADKYPQIKGLFIGNGVQENEISKCKNCQTLPFVKFDELPKYYNVADIGVWPREESTSMLDAMACGLPLVIADTVTTTERVEGNGLVYIENDVVDLAKKIKQLFETEKEQLQLMADCGIEKIQSKFSWEVIAKNREKDYLSSL